MNPRKLLTDLKSVPAIRKISIFFLTLILGAALLEVLLEKKDSGKSQNLNEIETVDTVIPYGFVLVPVELTNQEALSSMISDHAIIDLFSTASLSQKGGVRVGNKLRLVRAPLNPDKFAVLVSEKEASSLMSIPGPFSAVIQNKNESKAGRLESPAAKVKAISAWN